MRVMQNLLMIALPTTSMNRTMPSNPRITLNTPRHLMRVTGMIGRLRHRPMRSPTMRRLATLARTRPRIKIHLPPMMKTSLILRHDHALL
jgi:hypothetical protein